MTIEEKKRMEDLKVELNKQIEISNEIILEKANAYAIDMKNIFEDYMKDKGLAVETFPNAVDATYGELKYSFEIVDDEKKNMAGEKNIRMQADTIKYDIMVNLDIENPGRTDTESVKGLEDAIAKIKTRIENKEKITFYCRYNIEDLKVKRHTPKSFKEFRNFKDFLTKEIK